MACMRRETEILDGRAGETGDVVQFEPLGSHPGLASLGRHGRRTGIRVLPRWATGFNPSATGGGRVQPAGPGRKLGARNQE
jgi:hypothetical protein